MRIIGVAGKAYAGKDSIATWLQAQRGAYITSFANPIKAALIAMPFGLTWRHFQDPVLKEQKLPRFGRSPRELAQTLGADWGRDLVHPDLWVFFLEAWLKENRLWGADTLVVIPDVRFENEARLVRRYGFVIHVTRHGADGKVGVTDHASERGVSPASGDFLMENYGTLDDLYGKLGALFPRPVREAA